MRIITPKLQPELSGRTHNVALIFAKTAFVGRETDAGKETGKTNRRYTESYDLTVVAR